MPLTRAAVKLRGFCVGPQTITPLVGEDDLALLVPADEPISVGAPPVAPDLVSDISFVDAGAVRMRDSAGYVVSWARDVIAGRPRFTVSWTGLTKTERDLVIEFLRGVEITTQVAGGRNAFDIELDGESSGVTKVRPVEKFRDSWEHMTAYKVSVAVEEVW